MNDDEFYAFISESESWLRSRQEEIKKGFAIGAHEKYVFDQLSESIKFIRGNSQVVSFKFIPIGSYDEDGGFFQWAWSNKNVTEDLKKKARALVELDMVTGSEIFSQRKFECDDIMAWQITAICARHLNCIGVYAPVKNGIHRYFALMNKLV